MCQLLIFDQCVYIEDVGSMHGTYVEDRRITSHDRHRLYDNDLVKFGNEVTRGPGTCLVNDEPAPFCCHQPIRWQPLGKKLQRGKWSNLSALPESFPPLHVIVRYSWVDERYSARSAHLRLHADAMPHSIAPSADIPRMSQVELPPNTFQAPDYDNEDDEDDDISFVHETVLKPKLEVVLPPPTPDTQESVQAYEDASSVRPNLEVICRLSNDNSSSPLPRSFDSTKNSFSPAVRPSLAASGPLGLSEAERQADKRAMNLEHSVSSRGSSMSVGLRSPAKSSSSLPTSSLSKECEERPNVKTSVSVSHHQSTNQPTGLQKRPIIIDEDLTQSESDTDEAYSPDLMVDDSEDGQGRGAATDYGSDSDEEALLIAENRGSEVDHEQDDSTDSESSRSEFSDDIGMERDEDFFAHTENKMLGTKDPVSNDTYNEYDKATAEQEPVPYNMRPGNFTMPCTRLSVPPNSLNRAPSPSDAAMAKPCDFVPGSSGVPSGIYHYTNSQPWSNPMIPTYPPGWSCTLDGRPHAYDERYSGYQYPYGAGYASGQMSSDSFRNFTSQLSMLHEQSFNSSESGTKQPDRLNGRERSQPVSQPPPITISDVSKKPAPEVADLPQNLPKPAAKVSIDSIVEKVSDEPLPPQAGTTLKRKVDGMIIDHVTGPKHEFFEQITPIKSVQPPICAPQSKIASLTQIKAIQNVPSASGDQEERPAKRARTNNETRKTSFTTLAATALAGAVVGGVGVVAALVSLPPDFFV